MKEPWKNDDDEPTGPALLSTEEAGLLRDKIAREAAALLPSALGLIDPREIIRSYMERSPAAFEGPCLGMATAMHRAFSMMNVILHTMWCSPVFDPQVAYRLKHSKPDGKGKGNMDLHNLYGLLPDMRENYRRMLLGVSHVTPEGEQVEGDGLTLPSVQQTHMLAALMVLRDTADVALTDLVKLMQESIALHPNSDGAIHLQNCLNGLDEVWFDDKSAPSRHYYETGDPRRHAVPDSLENVPDPADPSEGRALGGFTPDGEGKEEFE